MLVGRKKKAGSVASLTEWLPAMKCWVQSLTSNKLDTVAQVCNPSTGELAIEARSEVQGHLGLYMKVAWYTGALPESGEGLFFGIMTTFDR